MGSGTIDNQGFHEARAIARRRRRRILVPSAVLLIMLAALVGIAINDYRTMRNDALTLSRGVIDNLQSRIETEVEAYLQPVPAIIHLAHDLFRARAGERLSREQAERVGIGMLRNTPQLTALYVGDALGGFRMVRRVSTGDAAFEIKLIRAGASSESGFENELTRFAADGTEQSREAQPWDGYDPRKRPWYTGAVEAGGLYWTDVYPFFTGQAAGITAALPNRDDQGAIDSVVGADVTLDDISDFLAALSIGRTGLALVIDKQGRLIAHPQAELLRPGKDGKPRLTRVADLGNPVVQHAFDRFRVEGHGRRDFTLGGRRYISSVSSLNHLLKRDWSILVVVPEDDFVGFVVENVSQTLALGLSVLALAALLAALLIRQGLRTDREAMRVLERQALLDAEEHAFVRLASSSARQVDPNDPLGLQAVTETLAEATGVRRVSVWSLSADARSLYCHDAFDRDTVGHTRGARLDASDHAGLFGLLRAGDAIASNGSKRDDRLATLFTRYLEPLGCDAVLGATIGIANQPSGVLWLEDRRDAPWADETRLFLEAVAAMIALRGFTDDTTPGAERTADAADDTAHAGISPATLGAYDLEPDTSLGNRRAEAFAARFAAPPGSGMPRGSEIIDLLPVMVLRLTDAVVLARPAHDDDNETTVAYLLRALQAAAVEHDIGYLKFLSDQMIASVDPALDSHAGIARLVAFALHAKQLCESVLAKHHAPLAFRIGIDLGPAIGTMVGDRHRRFTFWGEAVQMATEMADSSLPGAIQVTETVYRELRDEYLFQLRGHHYLERLGEFSTYLLSDRQ